MANEQTADKSLADKVSSEVAAQMKPILARLGTEIGEGIAAAMDRHSPRKVPFGRYDPRNIYHPNRQTAKTFRRGRDYYQNSVRLTDANTFDYEIDLLNLLSHSGTYINGHVTVNVEKNGDDEVVTISFPCSTADIRSEMKDHFRNFKDLLQQVVEAQAAELAEREATTLARSAARR